MSKKSTSNSKSSQGSSNKVTRERFSKHQVQKLEESYARSPNLDPLEKEKLAKELGVERRRIQIWFQNRRSKEKKKMKKQLASRSTIILPSQHTENTPTLLPSTEQSTVTSHGLLVPTFIYQPDNVMLSRLYIPSHTVPPSSDTYPPNSYLLSHEAPSPQHPRFTYLPLHFYLPPPSSPSFSSSTSMNP
ncbi:Homeodomain-like protein [Halteromyces radiatus]|uniref:Homeodomain-like protein n=1 Tax=Halteromyces radiatus TaxID=101107 RepID=UPI002220914D|nr:Homeodomain-like protein [Halteromyces radiatus]KAI8089859.1 Homeodomain-like protein [Halteromyces radiatus]